MSMAHKEPLTAPPQGVLKGLNARFAATNLCDLPDTNQTTSAERKEGILCDPPDTNQTSTL